MKNILFIAFAGLLLSSCIGDDIIEDRIDPVLRVNNPIDSLAVGSQFQFDVIFFNNVGVQEDTDITWTSSDASIISVSQTGLASAISAGTVQITASTQTPEEFLEVTFNVVSGEVTTESAAPSTRSGIIRTTTFYDLEGEFEMSINDEGNLFIDIADNYVASSSLPGFYLSLIHI